MDAAFADGKTAFRRMRIVAYTPAGTPPDMLRRLNADINRILQAPEVRERAAA
jgi:tripartite-type tricarboxylate transporter receptor subunit TctC